MTIDRQKNLQRLTKLLEICEREVLEDSAKAEQQRQAKSDGFKQEAAVGKVKLEAGLSPAQQAPSPQRSLYDESDQDSGSSELDETVN